MLAAGESARMGSWKLALPFRGATVLEWSVRNAAARCARVIVVTGYRGAEVELMLDATPGVVTVRNANYPAGMFSSIKAGVALVQSNRFFIALADMPLIPPETFDVLASAPHHAVVRPMFHGRKGHPVLLDKILIDRIRVSDDSVTMGDVLRGVPALELPLESEYVVYDLDTPSDYDRLPRKVIE